MWNLIIREGILGRKDESRIGNGGKENWNGKSCESCLCEVVRV